MAVALKKQPLLTIGMEHLADKGHGRRVVREVFRELELGLEEPSLIQLKYQKRRAHTRRGKRGHDSNNEQGTTHGRRDLKILEVPATNSHVSIAST